jgi:VCBS repeat-containing protein
MLPDLTASEILAIAQAENLSTRLVFFTESESDADLTAAIAAGACSAISKYANLDTMLRSLRLMTERVSASPDQSQDLSPNGKKVDGAKIENMLGMLTQRERQIVRLVCDGLSNKEIARQLNVSRGTVKVHLHNIFQKLEISNRTVLATIASLQRSAGFGTLGLAALAFAILSDAKASDTNDTDDDSTAYKDLEHSVFEPWKKAILRHIIVVDPGETVVLTQRGSPIKESQFTHSAAGMEERHAAEQAVLSNLGRGYGPIGSGTPHFFISPLLQAINKSQIGSPTAPQHFPPLEFASNLTKGHGGYGTFIMTAAGVWAYTLDNSNAAMQALDPGETLIDTFQAATMDGTTQVATITIHGASDVNATDVDNLAPGLVVHDSHPPLAFGTLGHDSVTGEGNAAQVICGGAREDTRNGTGVVDVIYGGSGNDSIEGNGGDDTIHGGSGSDTINGNNGNDTIISQYGGDQLTGSNGDDIFVYVSAIDSNSTQFDTIIDFTSGTDKINLAALGALAFLHLTSTSTSVPPHTLAWIYNPTSNQTIIYVNPTDRSLHIGDPGLLEIHLQGVVSVAEADFVYEPEAAAVAAALEGIDPALLLATASDGTVLTTGEAEASESTLGRAGVWTMPADDSYRFHFGRDRIGSIDSTRHTSFSGDSAYATVESNDCTFIVPVHVSSIEFAHNQALIPTEETFKKEPVYANTGAVTTGHGKAHAALGLELSEFGMQSAAIVAPVAVAEPVDTGDAPGHSGGHGNSQHASHSASSKASAAAELTKPGVTPGHSDAEHPSHSASANAGAAEPVETGDAPGNSPGHGNAQHASNSAAAKASAANELTEPGVTPGHGHSHLSHLASASAMGAAEPVEAGDAPGNSAGHGNAQHATNSAAAKASVANELTEPGVTPGHGHSDSHPSHLASASALGGAEPVETGDAPGKSAGHDNAQQASHSVSAKASTTAELTESGVTRAHSNLEHTSHSGSASAMGGAEPVETGDAPGNSASHGNAQHASNSATAKASAANELTEPGVALGHGPSHPSHSASGNAMGADEPVETGASPGNGDGLDCSPQASQPAVAEPADLTTGKSGGSSNLQQASHSATPNLSAAAEPVEFASWTGAGHDTSFHFKNQGAPSTPIEAVELEQFNDLPVLLGHAGDLAIPQVGPAAMEEHTASHINNSQHHAIGHLPHELLI